MKVALPGPFSTKLFMPALWSSVAKRPANNVDSEAQSTVEVELETVVDRQLGGAQGDGGSAHPLGDHLDGCVVDLPVGNDLVGDPSASASSDFTNRPV